MVQCLLTNAILGKKALQELYVPTLMTELSISVGAYNRISCSQLQKLDMNFDLARNVSAAGTGRTHRGKAKSPCTVGRISTMMAHQLHHLMRHHVCRSA